MTTTLADVCSITMGQAPAGDSYNDRGEGLPLIAGAGDFHGQRVSPKKSTSAPGKISAAGDIVLSIRASIGAKVWSDGEYCLGRGVAGLRPKATLDRGYLWHWLTHSERALAAKGRGATFLQVNRGDIGEMPINLPPLAEQRRIAAILDHADSLRAKRRQVLAHLGALSQSIYHDMFGNSTATVPLSDLVEGFRYGTSNRSGRRGQPTLRIPNVIDGGITTTEIKTVEVGAAELRRLTLRDGDLLFVRTNGNPDNVGRSAIFSKAAVEPAGFGDQPWIYASYLIRARLTSEALPDFVAAYLATPQGRKQLRERSKTSAGQYNINVEALSSVMLPAAPVAAQHHFASRAEAVKVNEERIRKATRADDVLFASLQSRAFRGEL